MSSSANVSAFARKYLTEIDYQHNPDLDPQTASTVWMHAVAIGYSPAYLSENADGIKRDWPRIPLPATREALEASAALGERVAALPDSEAGVPGVTTGGILPLLRSIGLVIQSGGGSVNPSGDDLTLTVNWGYAGQKGVTMPGRGRSVARAFTESERSVIAADAAATGQTVDSLTTLLGGGTLDVYLNDSVCWAKVPATVWKIYIGGHQVMKKWLSYREVNLLGRPLKFDEAREVTAMARRLVSLMLLRPKLDDNFRRVMADTFPWRPQPRDRSDLIPATVPGPRRR